MTESETPAGHRPGSPWMDKAAAAHYTGYSPRTLERYVSLGELRAVGGGGVGAPPVRFRREWLDEWMESRAHGGVSEQ